MSKKYRFLIVPVLFLAGFFAAIQTNAAGEVDPTFFPQAYIGEFSASHNQIYKIIEQPDGKLLIAGQFIIVNGVEQCSIVRLNADLTVDNSFKPPQFYFANTWCAGVRTIALQADGKVVVGGSFYGTNTDTRAGIVLLNADGSLDTSFNAAIVPNAFKTVKDIEIQPDGKLLLGGDFEMADSTTGNPLKNLVRLNADGSVDAGYMNNNTPTGEIITQPDGKTIVYFDNGTVVRRNADGTNDGTFAPVSVNGTVEDIKLDSDGKVLLAGSFSTLNSFSKPRFARLNADGTLDASFNSGNVGPNASVYEITFLANGKMMLSGVFSQYNNQNKPYLALLNADATLDNSFTYTPQSIFTNRIFYAVNQRPNGKFLIGGSYAPGITPAPGDYPVRLLNSDGSADTSFDFVVGGLGTIRHFIKLPDGKYIAAGKFIYANGNVSKVGLARFNQDGTPDPTFNYFGDFSDTIEKVAVQSNGKLLIYRQVTPKFVRLNTDGSIDNSFTPPSSYSSHTIYDFQVLPDDKILVGSEVDNGKIFRRLNANGSVDATFTETVGGGNSPTVRTIKVLANGNILIGGNFTTINGVPRGYFARLNSGGAVDPSFNPPFGANAAVLDLGVQSDGKAVILGNFTGVNGNTNYQKIARINTDGNLDTSFLQTTITFPTQLEIQSDDKILLTDVTSNPSAPQAKLFRLLANGAVDSRFTTAVVNGSINSLELQTDGSILIGGIFSRVGNTPRTNLARLLNAPSARTRFDFDGDGRSDISVFRPSNGSWYVQQSQNGFFGLAFGLGTDLPVPADFDGDGKTDIAVFRDGDWYYLRSSDNAFVGVTFGQAGDIPRPADFDGDGKSDINVFRPSTGSWYRLNSSDNSFFGVAFGQNGDQPLIADFDGDGKNDITVFRPSTGSFYSLDSSNGAFRGTAFGFGTDIPTPGDFDGDGKTDVAVFRPSNGSWYRLNSSDNSFFGVAFGQNGDVPTAADYDGDGKTDVAVFRNGNWYYLNSSNAQFVGVAFGFGTDKPIPAAFQQ